MTLKSIMYALSYRENKANLVRKEGARRVKQAQEMLDTRNRIHAATFGLRYGGSISKLGNLKVEIPKHRCTSAKKMFNIGGGMSKMLSDSSNNCLGIVFEGELDQLEAMQTFKNTH